MYNRKRYTGSADTATAIAIRNLESERNNVYAPMGGYCTVCSYETVVAMSGDTVHGFVLVTTPFLTECCHRTKRSHLTP